MKTATQTKIQTIDLTAKEWFDKVNGNSYFSARLTLNYGTPTEEIHFIPFQYGYDRQFEHTAFDRLFKEGIIETHPMNTLWRYCEENNIPFRRNKIEKCLKRDVISWGQN